MKPHSYDSASTVDATNLFTYNLFHESWDIPIYDGIVLTFTLGSDLVFGVGFKLEACILTMHGYGEVAPRFALDVNVGAAVSFKLT